MSKKAPKIEGQVGSSKASRWTRVLEQMPVKNEYRRPVEQQVTGKESKN